MEVFYLPLLCVIWHQWKTFSNRSVESIEDEVKHQGPDLQKKAKQAAYLQSKSREYKKHIQHSQVGCSKRFNETVIFLFEHS